MTSPTSSICQDSNSPYYKLDSLYKESAEHPFPIPLKINPYNNKVIPITQPQLKPGTSEYNTAFNELPEHLKQQILKIRDLQQQIFQTAIGPKKDLAAPACEKQKQESTSAAKKAEKSALTKIEKKQDHSFKVNGHHIHLSSLPIVHEAASSACAKPIDLKVWQEIEALYTKYLTHPHLQETLRGARLNSYHFTLNKGKYFFEISFEKKEGFEKRTISLDPSDCKNLLRLSKGYPKLLKEIIHEKPLTLFKDMHLSASEKEIAILPPKKGFSETDRGFKEFVEIFKMAQAQISNYDVSYTFPLNFKTLGNSIEGQALRQQLQSSYISATNSFITFVGPKDFEKKSQLWGSKSLTHARIFYDILPKKMQDSDCLKNISYSELARLYPIHFVSNLNLGKILGTKAVDFSNPSSVLVSSIDSIKKQQFITLLQKRCPLFKEPTHDKFHRAIIDQYLKYKSFLNLYEGYEQTIIISEELHPKNLKSEAELKHSLFVRYSALFLVNSHTLAKSTKGPFLHLELTDESFSDSKGKMSLSALVATHLYEKMIHKMTKSSIITVRDLVEDYLGKDTEETYSYHTPPLSPSMLMTPQPFENSTSEDEIFGNEIEITEDDL